MNMNIKNEKNCSNRDLTNKNLGILDSEIEVRLGTDLTIVLNRRCKYE